jgi:hypothetical protein
MTPGPESSLIGERLMATGTTEPSERTARNREPSANGRRVGCAWYPPQDPRSSRSSGQSSTSSDRPINSWDSYPKS